MKQATGLALVVACVALAGCGPSQPARLSFKGKVTYEGKPVVYGVVNFTPDRARGNKGAFGVGEILDGAYQSNPGYGATRGPMLVSFQVFDALPPNNKMLANIVDMPVEFTETALPDFHLTAKDIKPIKQ